MVDGHAMILGVVPVFINTGAAVLPAIIGPILAAMANIFKPRALWRIIRRNPLVFLILFLLIGLLTITGWMFFGSPNNNPGRYRAANPATTRFDWVQWARYRLENPDIGSPKMPVDPVFQIPTSQPVIFRGDAKRLGGDGVDIGLPMTQSWIVHPEQGASYYSTPTVVNSRIYLGAYVPGLFGAYGTLMCLDARNGDVIWKKEKFKDDELKAFFSSPAISADGKYLVVGEGFHQDYNCRLLCFDALTGEEKWAVKSTLHIESSPAIYGDLAVVGCGAIEGGVDHKPLTDPGHLLAVRISDGAKLWQYPLNDPEASVVFDSNGILYAGSGFNGNAVVALRTETDEQLASKGLKREIWRVSTSYPITSAISVADGMVYCGGGGSDYSYAREKGGGVYAIDAKTGNVLWSRDLGSTVIAPVSVAGDRLICPVWDGRTTALSRTDGSILWEQRLSGSNSMLAGVCVGKERAVALSKNGVLASLRLSDGNIEFRQTLGTTGMCISSPTSLGGMLYVARGQDLRAFRTQEGE